MRLMDCVFSPLNFKERFRQMVGVNRNDLRVRCDEPGVCFAGVRRCFEGVPFDFDGVVI